MTIRTVVQVTSKNQFIQALRGAAIAAVVLIHSLPISNYSIVVRPFVNWAVPMFLFLSGFLSTREKFESRDGLVARRLKKTLVPYAIWTLVYWLSSRNYSVVTFTTDLVFGSSSAQMYYLLVYAQLVVLTPWLYRMLDDHPFFIYMITPASLVVREYLALFDISIPHFNALFIPWLLFYLFGLDWDRLRSKIIRYNIYIRTAILALALVLQTISGFEWNAFGSYDLATTQLKMSNMLSAIAFIVVFMTLPRQVCLALERSKTLLVLGDASFGIYLVHMLLLVIVSKLFSVLNLVGFGCSLLIWICVLALSGVFVRGCQKILPSGLLAKLGFV